LEYKKLLKKYDDFDDGVNQARQDFLKSKSGRVPILPEWLEQDILERIRIVGEVGGKITPQTVSLLAKATIRKRDEDDDMKDLMTPKITLKWSRNMLARKGFVRRKQTTNRILRPSELDEAKLKMMGIMYRINSVDPSLVLMMDETIAPFSPCDSYTYAPEGSHEIRVASISTKKGCTVTFTITIIPQIIWEGLSEKSIPYFQCPDEFVNVYAGNTGTVGTDGKKQKKKTNKWQNRKTIVEYINKVIKPYITYQRDIRF
jgi:hypothetical protein